MPTKATRDDRFGSPGLAKISASAAGFMYQNGLFGGPVERRVDQDERR
jgi:hypothetical protein